MRTSWRQHSTEPFRTDFSVMNKGSNYAALSSANKRKGKMNWMGGARSRISNNLKGERKVQQEFFERKKLEAARSIANKTPSHRKRDLSQDLMALHTVSRIHSQFPTVSQRKSIKKLDLETFQSCTRPIEEVDMGPCSPTQTPSKIALSNSSINRESSYIPRSTDIKPSTEMKTENVLKPHSSTLPTGLGTCKVQTTQTEPSLKSKTSQGPQEFLENQQNHGWPMTSAVTPISFSKPGADSYQKNRLKFDPFVSEDFQVTPLLSYTKKRSPDNHESFNAKKQCSGENHRNAVESGQRYKTTGYSPHDQQRHRSRGHKHKHKSHEDNKHRPRNMQNEIDTSKVPDFETSTPMKNQKTEEFNKVSKFAAFEGVSPIFGAKKVLQDDEEGFHMKPRLMNFTSKLNLTHRGDERSTSQSTYSNERTTGNSKHQRLDKDSSLVSENYVEIFETPKNQNFIEYGTIDRQDCHNNNSTFKTESYEDSSSCELKAVMNTSQSNSGSSLRRYREECHSGRKRDSPLIEKETFTSYKVAKSMHATDTSEINKPHFTDLEEDGFKYKPLNTSSLKCGSFSGLINMYHTADNNSKGLQNETPRPSEALRKDYRHEKSACSGGSVQRVCSPVAIDEFPAHLTSPSNQLKDLIDNRLASIVKEEQFTDKKFNSISQSESSVSYIAKQSKMDDVLNEIMNLKEDTAVSDKTDETSQTNCQAVPPGGQTSESFEADAFIEADEYNMNAELEYMQSLEQNSKSDVTRSLPEETGQEDKTTDAEKTLGIPSSVVDTEALVAAIVPQSVETITQQNNERELLENIIKFVNSSKLQRANEVDKQVDIGGSKDIKTDTQCLASVDNNSISHMTTRNRNISSVHAAVNQTHTQDNVRERNTEQTFTTQIKHTNKQNRTVDYNYNMKRTSTIQDPEISSGHNKCTQTEIQAQRVFVNSSTSPLKDSSFCTNMCEIGIQCELNVFPTLSSLAAGSLTVAAKNNLYSFRARPCFPDGRP